VFPYEKKHYVLYRQIKTFNLYTYIFFLWYTLYNLLNFIFRFEVIQLNCLLVPQQSYQEHNTLYVSVYTFIKLYWFLYDTSIFQQTIKFFLKSIKKYNLKMNVQKKKNTTQMFTAATLNIRCDVFFCRCRSL